MGSRPCHNEGSLIGAGQNCDCEDLLHCRLELQQGDSAEERPGRRSTTATPHFSSSKHSPMGMPHALLAGVLNRLAVRHEPIVPLEPVVIVALACLILGESLAPIQIAGGVLVLGSAAWLARK